MFKAVLTYLKKGVREGEREREGWGQRREKLVQSSPHVPENECESGKRKTPR